jgi:hypothetical protein
MVKGKAESEERRFTIERTLDGIIIKIVDSRGRDAIEPILLPFTEAMKLGRILIANAKAGITQTELLVRKFAEIEHELRKLDDRVRELEKVVKELISRSENTS